MRRSDVDEHRSWMRALERIAVSVVLAKFWRGVWDLGVDMLQVKNELGQKLKEVIDLLCSGGVNARVKSLLCKLVCVP